MSDNRDYLLDKNRDITADIFKSNIDQLGLLEKFSTANSIVLKPNMAGGSVLSTDSHAMSAMSLLKDVITGIRGVNETATIYIAESDSAGEGYAFLKFENTGIDQWNIPGVELLDLSRDKPRCIEHPENRFFKKDTERLWLSEKLLDADIVVSLANIKTHSVTRFTGACKNLFGTLPTIYKYFYHPYLADVIHDIVLSVDPQLSIVDGFRGMEENGPIIGNHVDLGVRVWSTNAALADIVGSKLIKMNPRKIKHIFLLAKTQDLNLDIEGIPGFDVKYRVPTLAFFNFVGLKIQSFGYSICMWGHRIHCAYSITVFLMMAFRPILLFFFDLDTLKSWKRKLFD
jgi:uncharacterized protein (DUF362 family)